MTIGNKTAKFTVWLQNEIVPSATRIQIQHDLVDRLRVLVHLDFNRDAGATLELAFQFRHRLQWRKRFTDRANRRSSVRRRGLLNRPGQRLCPLQSH